MRAVAAVRLVAGREVRERVRSKAFLASTLLSLAILVVVVLVASGASGGDDRPSYDVAATSGRPSEVAAVAKDLARSDAEVTVTEVADEAEARRLIEEGDVDAALVGDEVLMEDELEPQLAALLQASHREVALATTLEEAGATPEQMIAANPPPLEARALDPTDHADERQGFALVGTMLLYAQLIGFGYWVASGIVEEKASRVVELLLPKTRAAPLLAGKVLGVGAVGLAQMMLFVATGLGLTAALGSIDMPPGLGWLAVALIGWFLAGYALYACLFAMAGALASRSEELQATTTPITLVIVAALFAAMFGADDPSGPMAQVTSFVPFTSPLVMPMRMAAGEVAAWEVALAVALVAASIVVVVRIAALTYAGGVLFTRGRLSIRDALSRSGS